MDCNNSRGNEKRSRRRKKSFTEALKEKYCVEDDPTFDFIIISPKRKTNSSAELAHLQTVVLNDMDITRADIPRQGLVSLCPNVVDLDLANNLLETWSELLSILSHLPKVRYLNVSRNRLRLDLTDASGTSLSPKLTVENLALNDTRTTIEEVVRLSRIMPALKELHLCENSYEDLANIEKSIRDGAFPCLECLRLNNNEISRWSEVWKLRHLPHLKCLIVSGNPIDNVFYQCEDRTDNNNTDVTDLHKRAGNSSDAAVSQKPSLSCGSDRENTVSREKCPQCECADSDVDMNGECNGIIIDNFDQEDGVTEERFDNDVDDDGRPVSRFEFHAESESSTGSCSDQDQSAGSECDDVTPSESDGRFGMLKNMHASVTGPNINNSCRGNVQKCLCEAYDAFDVGYLQSDDIYDNVDSGNDIEADDWHRAIAEEFLHDIIDGLNFDAISDQTVPQFQPSNSDQTHTANYSQEGVEASSNPDIVSKVNVVFSNENTTKLMISAESTTSEASVFEDNNASAVQESGFRLGYSFESSDIDAQFIPRAIRLLDDEVMNSFFYMATPSPPRSRVQRCLFKEPVCNGGSNSDELEDASYRDSSRHSASDSCSDCEAEQHKPKKQTANVGTGGGNVTVSAAFTSATPKPSPSHSKLESSNSNHKRHSQSAVPERSDSFAAANILSSQEYTQLKAPISNCRLYKDEQNVESNNNNNNSVSEHIGRGHHCDHSYHQVGSDPRPVPFQNLQMLCLSSANLHHCNHLKAFSAFPKLTNLRLKNNPLYSNVSPDDRRKLYIASLPKVNVLNGSEVSLTEREKAERHYLRHYMDKEEKPDVYHTLVKKHGPPVKLVDIDLSAGYQEWANLKFFCNGVEEFSRKIHLVEPVVRLRLLISQMMKLPKRCFVMYHHSCGPSHPESERELVELRCESLPMSRFDFADGDEIHIDVGD